MRESRDYYKKGDWNAICDCCLFKFKASELRRQWNGLMVCQDCFEERHPQELIKIRKERSKLPFTRPEGEDEFKELGPVDTSAL